MIAEQLRIKNDASGSICRYIKNMTLDGILLVAVTGVDGVGKTTFSNRLAKDLNDNGIRAVRVSVDKFHNPKSVRYAEGRFSPLGYYEQSFNYDAFIKKALEPARLPETRTIHVEHFDIDLDREAQTAAVELMSPCVLIIDGVFLLRSLLADYWDLSIYLDAPFEISFARLLNRENYKVEDIDKLRDRYIGGQKLHLQIDDPKSSAHFIVDCSSFE